MRLNVLFELSRCYLPSPLGVSPGSRNPTPIIKISFGQICVTHCQCMIDERIGFRDGRMHLRKERTTDGARVAEHR